MVELNKYPIPSEAATASYDWNDIASGAGYEEFYMIDDNGAADNKSLSPQALPSLTTTGKANETYLGGISNIFNLPRTIKGTAYISGYTYGAGTIGARITKISSNFQSEALGSVVASDATEYTDTVAVWQLYSTISVDDYVFKVEWDHKVSSSAGSAQGRIRFTYEEGDYLEITTGQINETNYTTYTYTNTYKKRKVANVKLYLYEDGSDTLYGQNAQVYQATYNPTVTETEIASYTSISALANGSFMIVLPCTETTINPNEYLRLHVTNQSGVDQTVDATGTFITTPTLKVNIPFKIDL